MNYPVKIETHKGSHLLELSKLEHQALMTLIEDFEDNLVIKRHEERLKSGEKLESYSLKQVKEICGI